jgi:hypothetical protein
MNLNNYYQSRLETVAEKVLMLVTFQWLRDAKVNMIPLLLLRKSSLVSQN